MSGHVIRSHAALARLQLAQSKATVEGQGGSLLALHQATAKALKTLSTEGLDEAVGMAAVDELAAAVESFIVENPELDVGGEYPRTGAGADPGHRFEVLAADRVTGQLKVLGWAENPAILMSFARSSPGLRDPFTIDRTPSPAFTVVNRGRTTRIVCCSLSTEQATRQLNFQEPTGTPGGWTIDPEATISPCSCSKPGVPFILRIQYHHLLFLQE